MVADKSQGSHRPERAAILSATTLRAHEATRESIGTGRYAAGQWLPEPMIAASLGLSRTTVREALRMLAAEGPSS